MLCNYLKHTSFISYIYPFICTRQYRKFAKYERILKYQILHLFLLKITQDDYHMSYILIYFFASSEAEDKFHEISTANVNMTNKS